MIYDLIIIGAGPAGITAAVYAARKRMNTLILTKDIGGQAAWSGDIENYTGYQFITGPELVAKFEEHLRKFDIALHENEEVKLVEKKDGKIFVESIKERYEAKTVIIASGKRTRELNVPGENKFKNKGLTYCATCDAPLFAKKTVAVIGGGNSALDATIQLTKIAKEIYLINIASSLTGDAVMQEQVESNNMVHILNDTEVISIEGEKFVNAITLKTKEKQQTLGVEGIFIEIGLMPNTEFMSQIELNDSKEIKVNCRNETNIDGIFAAGDVTDVPEKQIIIAAGEGSKAALSAFRYLIQHKF